ncbi:hepatocyte growth factor-regulated tyrosine kinase substrate-like isoform X2 [Panonychus citri]|nr:hepatocyte growth factor-regulated tyrosine kinase substrate-like isoform X2 [Panonychus citri]
MYATNPHVNLFALQLLESCMKNCGSSFHYEVATKNFMEELRELVKVTSDEKVREKILELIQAWAHAFRKEPSFRIIQDTYNVMKAEGHQFATFKETEAMFAADSAPQWADGDCCHRCRVQFNLVQRKHHCRNCGQIFCAKCSSKQSIIPKYGLEKEVRVCEDCFDKLNKPFDPKTSKVITGGVGGGTSSPFTATNRYNETKASEGGNNNKPSTTVSKTEQELQEEEDLQMAIALSKSEAETKEKTRLSSSEYSYSQPISSNSSMKFDKLNKMDPDVEKYLDRDYWESKLVNHNRSTSPAPSAPSPHYSLINNNKSGGHEIDDEHKIGSTTTPIKTTATTTMMLNKQENGVDRDIDTFLVNLKSALEIFVNRMNSNQIRGRPIANDTAVQSLFLNITNMHSQLLRHMQEQDDGRLYYEGLQDKLGQIRDARAALDSLREEHQEKVRLEEKKKNEYLQYQRQMALQRIQEQEREMLMRQEQQKYQWPQVATGQPQGNPQYPPQPGSIGYAAPTPGSQPLPPQGSVVYQTPTLNHPPHMVQPQIIQPPMNQPQLSNPQMGPPSLQQQQQPVTSSPSHYIGPQGPVRQPPMYQMPPPPYGAPYAAMVGPGVHPGIPMAAPLPQADHNQHPPQLQQQQQPPPPPPQQQPHQQQDTYNSNVQPPIEEPLISFD